MLAKLRMVDENSPPREIRVRPPMTIGRGREAKLTLAHALVSRIHCELYEVDGVLCIRDLGSLNGTYVGDVRVTEAALESGDILSIGAFQFELIIEEGKPSPPNMPASDLSDVALAVDDEPVTESGESSAVVELDPDEEDLPPLMPPNLDSSATEAMPDEVGEVVAIEDAADEITELIEELPEFAEVAEDEVMEVEAVDDSIIVLEIEDEDEPPAPAVPQKKSPAARPSPQAKAPAPQPGPTKAKTKPTESPAKAPQPKAKTASPQPKTPTPAAKQVPASSQQPAQSGGDFSFLEADSKSDEATAASDTNLNNFFKGLG